MQATPQDKPAGEAMPLALFDYDLPPSFIAQHPVEPRDQSRLMVLRKEGPPEHSRFTQLPHWLKAGDLLVVNRTQVIPARLQVNKPTGGQVELLLYEPTDGDRLHGPRWRALARPAKSLRPGLILRTAGGTELTVVGRDGDSVIVAAKAALLGVLHKEGTLPLPPYLQDAADPSPEDSAAYQSIFGVEPGAVAAPTASLHFTPSVMAALQNHGVGVAEVLLHVGPGTFLPVRPENAGDVRSHQMHAEWYAIGDATQQQIRSTRAAGGRVVAVGTTSLRALETWSATGAPSGNSTLFITPGYRFMCAGGLVTNFHLPKSTLLMLVSAMAGRERTLAAYQDAKSEGYRFYSFGDAMLILP